mmetsp:Transcript_10388/g.22196  ORF Transcript_10388/g.22196 Transcript_10388/m.22196 type:complete len:369 (-) Transcript_10388:1425-2531(-)
MGWILSISLQLNLYICFSSVGTWSNPLTLLGIAKISADVAMPVLAILFLLSPQGSSICDRTGLSLSVSKPFGGLGWQQPNSDSNGSLLSPVVAISNTNTNSSEDGVESCNNETTGLIHKTEHEKNATAKIETTNTTTSNGNSEDTNDTMKLFFQGLKIMFMDVAIQGCTTFTLYVAPRRDSAVAYQIGALPSALPSYGYGYGYATGISMIFKSWPVRRCRWPWTKKNSSLWSLPRFASRVCSSDDSRYRCRDPRGPAHNCSPVWMDRMPPPTQRKRGAFDVSNRCLDPVAPGETLPFGVPLRPWHLVLSWIRSASCCDRSCLLALLDFDFLVTSTIGAILVYRTSPACTRRPLWIPCIEAGQSRSMRP